MEKRIAAIGILIILIMGCIASFPAYAFRIGYIDFGRVFNAYQETQKAQAYLSEQEQKFIQEYKEAYKKVKETKDGILKTELEFRLTKKKQKLEELRDELTIKLHKDIRNAIEEMAKDLNIDIVIEKSAIINANSGIVLTNLMIIKLKNKK